MASEDDVTSDSLDVCVIDVPDYLLDKLKSLVVKHITEAEQFSAQIVTCTGQSAKLKFSLGLKAEETTHSASKGKSQVASTSDASTILVKNIPPNVDEDLLELFFEAEKKQGGGPVKCVKQFSDKHCAIVEFKEVKSVGTVMKKIPIKYGETTLDIQPYFPLLEGKDIISHLEVDGLPRTLTQDILRMQLHHIVTPVKQDEEEEKSERSGHQSFYVIDDERVNKVLVSGLPEGISEDFLELAFEKRGGVVIAVEMNRDDNSAVIEFQDPDAVEEVLGKGAIKINNVVVDVKKYEPPPFEEPPQCTVRVSSIPHSVSEEFLLLYFENEKRSGGDVVAKMEFKEGDNVAFVTYETEEVARRVVERQQFLNHVEVEVCLHSPVQTKHSQEQYRNQERDANQLIKETKAPNLEKEGRNLHLKYDSSVECEIPAEWTKIATQDTVGMDDKQRTPAVPPKVPRALKSTPRRFYENITQQGPAPPRMNPGMPQPVLPKGFDPPRGQPFRQYALPDQFHCQPGAPFGFPMGLPPNMPRGPFPSGQGGGQNMPMPRAFRGPNYQMLQNQGVPQQHGFFQSGPQPPYNGSLPDQTDHTDSPDTTSQKVAVEEHQLSELKAPVPKRRGNDGLK